MRLLKNFVAALQAGWFPALVAFFGCLIIIWGNHLHVPYLDLIPDFILTIIVLVGVFSFSALIIKELKQYKIKRKYRKKLIRDFEALLDEEKIF